MKIVFSELENWEEDYIKKKLKGHKVLFLKNQISLRNIEQIKDTDILCVFIYSELNDSILSKFLKLKFIITMSTGYDHINLDYCKRKGIKISNVPSYGGNTVAEHTFALILNLSRKVHIGIERTKQDNFSLKGLMGFDLKGKTLGIIGVGRIGQHVSRIARGFEMNVMAYSLKKDLKLSRELGFKWVSFNELLRKADIITLHVPLTSETNHLINMKNIKKIKKGTYIINTARGEIIDTKALLYGLDNGIIAGAGLDVLEGEEDIKDEKALLHKRDQNDWETFLQNHLLLKEKNVIITPHSAFYTHEALERILDATIDNIKQFLRGRVLNSVY